MRIIVFSDSHRDIVPMIDVIERMSPDMIIHLGDHINDAVELNRKFQDIPMEMVKGNCDLSSSASSFKVIKVSGKNIFITHGDAFGVRSGTATLVSGGKKAGADIILYGHTHKPVVKKKKGILLMNPGSIGRRTRGMWPASFGVLDIESTVKCHTLDYDYIMQKDAIVP